MPTTQADFEGLPVVQKIILKRRVRRNLIKVMRYLEDKTEEVIWIEDGMTLFERLAELYLENGGKIETLSYYFPHHYKEESTPKKEKENGKTQENRSTS